MEKVKPWLGEPAEYNSRTAEVRLCISEKVWSEFSDRSTCAG